MAWRLPRIIIRIHGPTTWADDRFYKREGIQYLQNTFCEVIFVYILENLSHLVNKLMLRAQNN